MYKGGPENLEALEGPECLTGPMEDPEGLKCPEHCEDLGGPERLEDPEGLKCPEYSKDLGGPEKLEYPEGPELSEK